MWMTRKRTGRLWESVGGLWARIIWIGLLGAPMPEIILGAIGWISGRSWSIWRSSLLLSRRRPRTSIDVLRWPVNSMPMRLELLATWFDYASLALRHNFYARPQYIDLVLATRS
ncbi:uncharacterized protein EV422DRAFT_614681 [Fimicolochytrium jonesii]|uniref:uncharacterized protein n=1 Tax=Fimicolochytrium jonesii TaxID=1396493 RepID=UPI0022FDEB0D|nr:uncharacterized protein EV422DRAFT_614681 [Fimicolochytrium jonesii]KAI8822210.1 hypothetical protein EV422DRAFT_614681 [Fimicolochytrium jonesii]